MDTSDLVQDKQDRISCISETLPGPERALGVYNGTELSPYKLFYCTVQHTVI